MKPAIPNLGICSWLDSYSFAETIDYAQQAERVTGTEVVGRLLDAVPVP